ncbi:MAG: DUF1772 domain-containing protein [Myxococcales bacterium]|nr:DUF1772 domain-containing protein [Myxococcales bacterium]MDH3842860.1 DUF1772 domain-containing protein [Myxococcales bacterium]
MESIKNTEAARLGTDELHELAHGVVFLDGMAHRQALVDRVVGPAPLSGARNRAGFLELTLGLVRRRSAWYRCDMELFHLVVLVAAGLCALVAGFLFAFAVVAMPGLENLSDREFIRAFQVMDRVIQDRQPLFMLVWLGSVVALLLALAMGFQQQDGLTRGLLVAAAAVYLFGVQLTTARVNIPLNNEIQSIEVAATGAVEQKQAREHFEARWNRSNRIRTAFAVVTMLLLLVVLMRLPAT